LLKTELIIWDYVVRPDDITKPIVVRGVTGGDWDFQITVCLDQGLSHLSGLMIHSDGAVYILMPRQAQEAFKMAWICLRASDFPTKYDKT